LRAGFLAVPLILSPETLGVTGLRVPRFEDAFPITSGLGARPARGTTGALKFTAWRWARLKGAETGARRAAARSARSARRSAICRIKPRNTPATPRPATPERR